MASQEDKKRLYWMKLHDDFFSSKRIKKLRKLGADFVIIYLKMQLLSLNNNGILEYCGIEDTFAEEIALDIDEDEDKVQLTISYLQSCGLLEIKDDEEFFLPYVEKCTGSETIGALKKRKYRASIGADATQTLGGQCPTEIDIEKEIEKEIETNNNKNKNISLSIPDLQEVDEYCLKNSIQIDVDRFWNYYNARGWTIKGEPMVDWHSALRIWQYNEEE